MSECRRCHDGCPVLQGSIEVWEEFLGEMKSYYDVDMSSLTDAFA